MKEEPEELKVWKRSPNIAGLPPEHSFTDEDIDDNARMIKEDEEYNENCSDGE